MAIELRHCDFSSHAWNEIYTWGISVFFFLSTLKMRVNLSLCEKRFSTSWHFGETKTKPQRHQSLISPRFSTLCGTKPARQSDIPLNGHFLRWKPTISSPTARNLFYMCEICLACRMSCGWWDLWIGSVFPHYVTGLFISVMANHPDSCEGFSPRPHWSTHPLTCI